MPRRRTSDDEKRAKGVYTPARSWEADAPPAGQAKRAPSCPADLAEPARKVWRELVPQIARRIPLSSLDRDPLAGLCLLTVEYRAARKAGRVSRPLFQQWRMLADAYGVAGRAPPRSRLAAPPKRPARVPSGVPRIGARDLSSNSRDAAERARRDAELDAQVAALEQRTGRTIRRPDGSYDTDAYIVTMLDDLERRGIRRRDPVTGKVTWLNPPPKPPEETDDD